MAVAKKRSRETDGERMSVLDDLEDFDFGAVLTRPTRRFGQTLKGRREIERQRQSEADRRKVQTTGRTEQLNIRVRPMTKLEFVQQAKALGILPTELFERAWENYKQITQGG